MKLLLILTLFFGLLGCSTTANVPTKPNAYGKMLALEYVFDQMEDRQAAYDLKKSLGLTALSSMFDYERVYDKIYGISTVEEKVRLDYVASDLAQRAKSQRSISSGGSCHSVRSYTRKDGTYVRGYTRCR
ncbi:hypothetical protein [Thiothrix nivea]|uniref:Lipoprotein n=1 Tax=Thiothrix nivea (strain ATCC 35100 / DSM 5205 / JP2) TaxID=870187 RepID=A0A656HHD9_THINJ|nr:hypothetical protein [Thiothrix nivea]EIJ35444.1 hypothetical protein Thini_2914 [Thiothrix nivea DSM 5205]